MTPVLAHSEDLPRLVELVANSSYIGLDCETYHSELRDCLKHTTFDPGRIRIAGISLYSPVEPDRAYYLPMGHAGTSNLSEHEILKVIEAKKPGVPWIIHNAPFELMVFKRALGHTLQDTYCTLQLAVSMFDKDQYNFQDFSKNFFYWLKYTVEWMRKIGFDNQEYLISHIASKSSTARHSYNGLVESVAYGYGLKQLVSKLFGVKMTTYDEITAGKPMNELTGSEVCSYACDDAYYAVKLWELLISKLSKNKKLLNTYLEQENPMTRVYADIWSNGLKIDIESISKFQKIENDKYDREVEKLLTLLDKYRPFPAKAPHLENEPWYDRNYQKILDTLEIACSKKSVKNLNINFTFYMVVRSILFGILGLEPEVLDGKIQSDDEARGRLAEKTSGTPLEIIETLNNLATIRQIKGLYLEPYSDLVCRETKKVYPVVSSQLVTRRMAAKFPNPMQLAKRGPSKYIRELYIPDREDHLIVSIDWSSIELVEIGEFSRDPNFIKAFGQLPYKDLHSGAAAAILKIPEDKFIKLPEMSKEEALDTFGPRILKNIKGQEMSPKEAFSYWRTELGKGSNFNYWYSGSLSTTAKRMGWTDTQMWEAVDLYRTKFAVAEEWRQSVCEKVSTLGYIELPDGHRRVRFEATDSWRSYVEGCLSSLPIKASGVLGEVFRRIRTRAKNQAVNALIQGTCATIAKRSILRILTQLDTERFRFLIPIHDELVFSVHESYIEEFIKKAVSIMTDHRDIFKIMKLHATPSIGPNFGKQEEIDLKN